MTSHGKKLFFLLIATLTIATSVVYLACSSKNRCLNQVCLNGGSCNGGVCECPTGIYGPHCDSLARDKYISYYHGGDSCNVPDYPDSIVPRPYANSILLTARIAYPKELLMNNVLNNPNDSAYCTMASLDSFTFLGASNSTQYSGWGKFSHDSLFMHYHVIHDTTSYDCSYIGKRY